MRKPLAIPSLQQHLIKVMDWSKMREKVYIHVWTTVLKEGREIVVDILPTGVSKNQNVQVTACTHSGCRLE